MRIGEHRLERAGGLAHGEHSAFPIVLVALTGYGSEEDRRRSEAAGFNYHMVKPVHFDALNELLAALDSHKK